MRISDFDLYQELLQKKSGLYLEPAQSYLLDSRLTPVAKKWGYPTLSAMTISLRGVPSPGLLQDIVEAMTFKETAFFYDKPACIALRESLLPYFVKRRARQRTLRIWSAACGTGQEAYSLAVSVLETPALASWKVEILATDISGPFLEAAKKGVYSQVEMQRGLPVDMLLKHAVQSGKSWQLNDNVRALVEFRPFNLVDEFDLPGIFDIIACRNVLPYFDEKTKSDVLNRMTERLAPDGFLLLGEDESLPETEDFKPLEDTSGLYILSEGMHKKAALAKIAS